MKGGMQNMLKQVQKMQAEMQKVQAELGNLTVSEDAGGGMIKATANGNKEIISGCRLGRGKSKLYRRKPARGMGADT